MQTILLTGFAPFGTETTNPSWDAIQGLQGSVIEGLRIVCVQLPCEFDISLAVLQRAMKESQPKIVVCLGQAGGRSDISIERVAININDARIPDNARQQPIDTPVVQGGPVGYFSTLPIKTLVHTLSRHGIPASVSHSAGTYVCNHVFYGLMHALPHFPCVKSAGFVHVPYSPAQATAHPGASSMEIATMTEAVRIIVATTLRTTHDVRISGGITH